MAAAVLNALFLLVLLQFYTPYFESNDDYILMHLADGAYGFNEFRLVYINIGLGLLFKLLYSLVPAIQWYTVLQYVFLYMSFTLMCFVLVRRWKPMPALICFLSLLLFYGLDAYVCIHYTKTASLLTVAGLMLMFHALEREEKVLLVPGFVLALLGMMYRNMQFFACGVIVCFVVIELLAGERKPEGSFFAAAFRRLCPFAVLLAAAALIMCADRLAYRAEDWSAYMGYNSARTEVMDFGKLPAYGEASEAYEDMGISEDMMELISTWDFYDPDIVDEDAFLELAELSRSEKARENTDILSSVLGYLSNIIHLWAALPLLVMGLVWLLFGRHDKFAWIIAVLSAAAFLLIALCLVLKGRYNIYWVEYGLVFSLCSVLLWLLPRADERHGMKAAFVCLALSVLLFTMYLPGWNGKFQKAELAVSADYKHLVSQLEESEKLVIADTYFSDGYINYSVFSREDGLVSGNLLSFGGWQIMYPELNRLFAEHGVKNPYRDCVNNDDVLVLTGHIELTLSHIRNEYYPDAQAECLSTPEEGLGYGLYRINE